MARRCELTGKSGLTGNNVSHAKNRTKRRFLPNLCNVTLASDALGRSFKMKVSANALRTIDKNGGLDRFLLSARESSLSLKARRIKRSVQKSLVSGA